MGQGFLTNISDMTPLEGGVEYLYPDIEYFDVGFGWNINIGDWVFFDEGGLDMETLFSGNNPWDSPAITALSETRALLGHTDGSYNTYTVYLLDISNGASIIDYVSFGPRVKSDNMHPRGRIAAVSNSKAVVSIERSEDSCIGLTLIDATGDSLSILDTTIATPLTSLYKSIYFTDLTKAGENRFALLCSESDSQPDKDYAKIRLYSTASGSIQLLDSYEILNDELFNSCAVTYNGAGKLVVIFTKPDGNSSVYSRTFDVSGDFLGLIASQTVISTGYHILDNQSGIGVGIDPNHILVMDADYSTYPNSGAKLMSMSMSEGGSLSTIQTIVRQHPGGSAWIHYLKPQSGGTFTIAVYKKGSSVFALVLANNPDHTFTFVDEFTMESDADFCSSTKVSDSRYLIAFIDMNWTVSIVEISIGGGLRPATPEDMGNGMVGVAAGSGGSGASIPVRMAY